MTPGFANAVDPIIEMMLTFKEQIEKNTTCRPDFVRQSFIQRIAASEKLVHEEPEEWDLARFALVTWIDEQLVYSLAWPYSASWNQQKLQTHYYRTQTARESFFERAAQAERSAQKDALEVFFICVVLGFKGVYDPAAKVKSPKQMGLPDNLQDWIRKTRQHIKLNDVKVVEKEMATDGFEATPLKGKYDLLRISLTFFVTAVFAGLVIFLLLVPSKRTKEDHAAVSPTLACHRIS